MGTSSGKRVPEMSLINSFRGGEQGGEGRRWRGGNDGCEEDDEEEKEEIMRRGRQRLREER